MTPKKLRARKSAGGWRTNVASAQDEGRRDGEEPRLAADEQDQAADEQPADAGLGRE